MLLSGHQQGDTQHGGTPLGPHMNIPLQQFLPAARARVGTEMPAVAPLGSSMEGHQLSYRDFQTAPAQPLDIIFTLQVYLPLRFLIVTQVSVFSILSAPDPQLTAQVSQLSPISIHKYPHILDGTVQTSCSPSQPSVPAQRKKDLLVSSNKLLRSPLATSCCYRTLLAHQEHSDNCDPAHPPPSPVSASPQSTSQAKEWHILDYSPTETCMF